ncbi:hypothetical protein BDZ94DRAFT_1276167, partial [Collybia nuda]
MRLLRPSQKSLETIIRSLVVRFRGVLMTFATMSFMQLSSSIGALFLKAEVFFPVIGIGSS